MSNVFIGNRFEGNVYSGPAGWLWQQRDGKPLRGMEAWRTAYLAQCDGCPLAGECRSGCLAQAIWRGQVKDPLIRL